MMICLQILLTIIVAEETVAMDGISRIMAAESQERRQLFIDVDWGAVTSEFEGLVNDVGETLDDGTSIVVDFVDDTVDDFVGEVDAFGNAIADGTEVLADGAVAGWTEFTEVADSVLEAVENVATEGLKAIENLPVDDIVDVLKTALSAFDCGPKDCMTDFTVKGCMPTNNNCQITYGKECLKLSGTIGTYQEISASAKKKNEAKNYGGYVEGEAGVTLYGAATVTVDTSAEIALQLSSEPRVAVIFNPPSIEMEAEVGFDFEANAEIKATEKRVPLSSPKMVYKKAFMAGPIPVVVGVMAQPVAILSGHGKVDASGTASYKFSGKFGFQEKLKVELGLLNFEASHNFDTITMPAPEFNDEGFNFDLEINGELQLDVKLGVEFAFQLYNSVEFNLVPMIATTFTAHADVAASGNNDGATGSASADATICLGGEFDSYFDYAFKNRRQLESINLLGGIEDACKELRETFLGENCLIDDLMNEVLDVCEVATDILEALGFPATIDMPSLSDFDIPALPTPKLCYDTSLGTSSSITWDEASSEGSLNEVFTTGSYGIHNGNLHWSVSIEGCDGQSGDEYVCGNKNNWIKWPVHFGRSDFVVESEFRATSVSTTALAFVLWSDNTQYYIGLDGGNGISVNNVYFYQGGIWGGAKLLGRTTLDPSRSQSISLKRVSDYLLVTFDGITWDPLPFGVDVTAVGWRPWRNTIRVKTLQHFNPHVNYGIVNGDLDSSVSVTGHCTGRQGSEYVCSGTGRYVKWNVEFGNSDFVVESEFKASSVAATALSFVLWSDSIKYYVGLDGSGNTRFFSGGEWGGTYIIGSTNLDPSRYQKIELRRTGNSLLVTFDGHKWLTLSLSASITAVGWRPWRNSINIKNLLHY